MKFGSDGDDEVREIQDDVTKQPVVHDILALTAFTVHPRIRSVDQLPVGDADYPIPNVWSLESARAAGSPLRFSVGIFPANVSIVRYA